MDEDRKRYASEKEDNFRWISALCATWSDYTLGDIDLVPERLRNEISCIGESFLLLYSVPENFSCDNPGQFAEVVYSAVPLKFLIDNHAALSRPRYPLENYDALRDCVFLDAFRGTCADLPAFIIFRPLSQQLVVSISGTASISQMLYNLRVWRTVHPLGRGQVHSGFFHLYCGIRDMLLSGIRKGVAKYQPLELVLTGHSMGASMLYLLVIELLAQQESILSGLKLRMYAFGSPRVGDSALVDYFLSLVQSFRKKFGQDAFWEYSVKGYNDGKSPDSKRESDLTLGAQFKAYRRYHLLG